MQTAGRWTDVFRLAGQGEITIGRSSKSDITVRSEKASRMHTRLFPSPQGWLIEDLSSRNGTLVNGNAISEPTPLKDRDRIQVAGFSLQFVLQINHADGPVDAIPAAGTSDDQATMGLDGASITDRIRQSGYLHDVDATGQDATGQDAITATAGTERQATSQGFQTSDLTSQLLRLAFDLAASQGTHDAVERMLDCLQDCIHYRAAGVYLIDLTVPEPQHRTLTPDALQLVATRQRSHADAGLSTYRRAAPQAMTSVIGPDGQAILARNIGGDQTLATANTQGEIEATSMILAPVRDREGHLLGVQHLFTNVNDPPLTTQDLEFVLAAGEILAESLRNLQTRGKLDRSLQKSKKQLLALRKQLSEKVQIVGNSASVKDIIEKVTLVGPTNATVLVRGESGVGKELVASAIHHASKRANGPLVCMNCAALSPSLLESELFGHEKGAFTGATDRKPGKFEAADGGTLMLDEIGEMDPEIQAKFLRVLEGHPFERVGGQASIKVDVRVVAATNRDLQQMVAEGSFRQDLFYRLHVVEVLVPPLRQRGADVVVLAHHFLQQFNAQMGRRIESISSEAEKMLLDYRWPGNIRELRNVIERAVVLNSGTRIEAKHLMLTPAAQGPQPDAELSTSNIELSLSDLEQQHIQRVLRHTDGNKSRAANILGIERSTLDRKLKKFAK